MPKAQKTYFPLLVFLLFCFSEVSSQTTYSPYSIFGLGYIEDNSIGPSKAMGGTGIGFLSQKSINIQNPASYSGLDSLLTIYEMGMFAKYTMFSTNTSNQSLVNANFKYAVMGFRVTPWLATSFGLAPYSSVGYNINAKVAIEGSNQEFQKTYSGDGGVNQVYLGGSVNLIRNLSLGFNAAYLFGNITTNESSNMFNYTLKDITYVSNFNFNYGLNYQINLKKWICNLGLTYNNSKTLQTKNTVTIETNNESEEFKGESNRYTIPRSVGAGIAISTKDYFSAGFDYEWSNWEKVKVANALANTRNSNRFSLGVEFPSLGIKKGTGKMIFYRFGAEYRQSYLIINNTPINYFAVTLGSGIPLKGVISVINVSLELGQNGTTKKGLFRENFATLHLDLALRDIWFLKKKYE